MEFEDLERILELVRQHDLSEFELERDGLKIRVRKTCAVLPPAPSAPPPAAPVPHTPAHVPVAAPTAPIAAQPAAEEEAVELAVVKSPIVGTFYLAPEPGAPPFVEVGDRVKKDQVLCIIEAMK